MPTISLWVMGFLALAAFSVGILLKIVARIAHGTGHSVPCPASFSWIIDNPLRRRYMRPVPEWIGIRPGERVLELGPGAGVFTVEAARRAGPEGRLTVVDIQPEMIGKVDRRLRAAGVKNAETHVADAYHLPLPGGSIDRAFLVTVLGEIADRRRALAELRRVLRPGGVLSITEEFLDPDYPFAGETIRLLEGSGFRLCRRAGNAWLYTLNFESADGLRPGTLELLACPSCKGALSLRQEDGAGSRWSLRCGRCRSAFPIRDGIIHFLQSGSLTGPNRRFAKMYDWMSWFYRPFSPIMFAFMGISESKAHREITGRLEPRGGRVLEVSIGPGVNLPYLRERTDVGGIFGLDISLGQLQRCRAYVQGKGWPVELFLANAEELPYRDNSFEAVFHVGGINFFNDKRKAIAEMIRVAKPGARILIADESERGMRAYEITIPFFSRYVKPDQRKIRIPADLVPAEMEQVKVSKAWNGYLYLLEFRKPGGSS